MENTIIGVNIPWWNGGYGHDFGINYMHLQWPVTFNEALIRNTFEYLSSIHLKVIRFWLFESGEGLVVDDKRTITALDPEFEKNLIIFVGLAKEFDLKIYYTLFDANSIYRNDDFITESIIANPTNTDKFCNLILPKILKIVEDTTWAIDLCNEPEAAVRGETGNHTDKGYGWKTILSNFGMIFHCIRNKYPQIKMSIGSGFQEEKNIVKGIYDNIGFPLDFIDYHSHRTDGYVPEYSNIQSGFLQREIIIGELSACEGLNTKPSRVEWRKNQGLILKKLHLLKHDKYKAIFLWRLNPCTEQYYNEHADTLIYNGEKSTVLFNLNQFI